MIPYDILEFVESIVNEWRGAGLPVIAASSDIIKSESVRFLTAFGFELPQTYVDICRIKDGFSDNTGTQLHGLGTYFEDGNEIPEYEGLMEVHKWRDIDLAPLSLIEFGNRNGTEPWGWNFVIGKFVRAEPNGIDVMEEFDSFDEMFRGLFILEK